MCIRNNLNLNIELKPNTNFEKINAYKVFELTKNIEKIDIFFSSFDIISIIEISKIFPNSIRSILLDNFKDNNIDDLINFSKKLNINICGLNIDIISTDIIKKLKENNILITVYSDKNINLSNANYCFAIGVDSIFVDDPRELLK